MADEDLEISVPASLVEEIVANVEGLLAATSINEQALYANRLNNTSSDLASWHPRWNLNTGEIDAA